MANSTPGRTKTIKAIKAETCTIYYVNEVTSACKSTYEFIKVDSRVASPLFLKLSTGALSCLGRTCNPSQPVDPYTLYIYQHAVWPKDYWEVLFGGFHQFDSIHGSNPPKHHNF
jgi:hypothetical protein